MSANKARTPAVQDVHTSLTTAVGLRGIAFLHRVAAGSSPYRISSNADRDAIEHAVKAVHVQRVHRAPDLVTLTDRGRAFLDSLMRAH
jgi:hypothetical protein